MNSPDPCKAPSTALRGEMFNQVKSSISHPDDQSSFRFAATLQGLRIYTNEERTRTFIAAPLDAAFVEKMTAILQPIDQVMLDYRLQQFYDPASFHVSLLWCVGDQETLLNEKLTELKELLDDQDKLCLAVNEVHLKCGNKDFTYTLK